MDASTETLEITSMEKLILLQALSAFTDQLGKQVRKGIRTDDEIMVTVSRGALNKAVAMYRRLDPSVHDDLALWIEQDR